MKEMLKRIEESIHRHRCIYYEYNILVKNLIVGIDVENVLQPIKTFVSYDDLADALLLAGLIDRKTLKSDFVIFEGTPQRTWFAFSEIMDKETVLRHCLRAQIESARNVLDDPMAHIHTFWHTDLTTQQALLWALKDEPTAPAFIRTIHTIIKEKNHTMFWKREHLHLAYFIRDNSCILNCVKPKCCTHEI